MRIANRLGRNSAEAPACRTRRGSGQSSGAAAFLALMTVLPASARADALTLQQALVLAERHHPQLQAGAAQVEVAKASQVTARAYPNPEAAVLAGRQTYRVPGNVSGLSSNYSISQPLELGPLRPARMRFAERGRESSEQSLAGTRLMVLAGVRRAFYQALRKQSEIAILEENLRLVEDFRQRTRLLVEVGEAGRLELIRADSEVATARAAMNAARRQYIADLAQLRGSVGATLGPDVKPEGALDAPAVLPSLEEVRREALERHPALLLSRAEVRRAEARVELETAQRLPQPSIRAEIDQPPDTPTYRVGIALPLPLWNRREGPIAEAVAQLRQMRAIDDSRRIEIQAAVESAYGRHEAASQQLAAFEEGLLREAEEGLRAAETAYRLGERGILDVLDAQRMLRTVRLDFLNARYDRQAALIDLDELRAVELKQ